MRSRRRARRRPSDVAAASGVHPQHAVTDWATLLVYGNGARPLARDADGHHLLGAHRAAAMARRVAVDDDLPPLLSVLHRAAAVAATGY